MGICKKISKASSFYESKYFKASKLGREMHENLLPKIIFSDESLLIYDGPDGWAKLWNVST